VDKRQDLIQRSVQDPIVEVLEGCLAFRIPNHIPSIPEMYSIFHRPCSRSNGWSTISCSFCFVDDFQAIKMGNYLRSRIFFKYTWSSLLAKERLTKPFGLLLKIVSSLPPYTGETIATLIRRYLLFEKALQ
jgi:hypothetical protein